MAESSDVYFMEKALALAEKGRGAVSPNPLVGAVVVKDGRIIATGYHARCGDFHAEAAAIDSAGAAAAGADLYVTLEPCNHQGRTPACTEKILSAGIRRVVAAMADPNPRVKGGGMAYLKRRGVRTEVGVCKDAARRQNAFFIKYITTGRPFVIAKCAATLDGRIASRTGHSKWITGPAARTYVHQLRNAVDAVMVGVGTVQEDDPQLTTRLPETKGRDPVRIILDTRLTTSPNAKVVNPEAGQKTVIVTGPDAPGPRIKNFQRPGVKILPAALSPSGRIDLASLMGVLGKQGITSILLEGGGRVMGSAFSAGIVDKIAFFFAPKIAGGSDGVPICQGPGPGKMDDCTWVSNMTIKAFGPDILIEGDIKASSESQ